MNIVTLVKHVPVDPTMSGFDDELRTSRGPNDGQLSQTDEYAIEQSLQLAESLPDTQITYLTVGPAQAVDAVRKALAFGGDRGCHVLDDGLAGSDAMATSRVLAASLQRLEWDLIVCGMASTDGWMGVVPAMVAERLRIPAITSVGALDVSSGSVRARRDSEHESQSVTCAMPCLISVSDQTGEPRYPSFKGLMASKKKPIDVWTLDDLDVPSTEVGVTGSFATVRTATAVPPRQAGVVVQEDPVGHLVDFLVREKFI